MTDVLRGLVAAHRPLWVGRPLWAGLGVLVLAALDLADPALLTGVGVLVLTLASETEA